MTPDTPPPSATQQSARAKAEELEPSFFRAWRGVWRLTWKSQLTWQRLPAHLLGLLILPVLVWLTTSSPEGWAQRRTVLGDPASQVNDFAGRLIRAKLPLTPEQRDQLRQIFIEEFARVAPSAGGAEAGDASRSAEQLRTCYEKIQTRAQPFLDASQLSQLQNVARRTVRIQEGASGRGPVWTRSSPFYHWLIDLYFFIVLPLNCVRVCGGLIRDELQADTLGFLTTRPPGRGRLLILKYLSQTACLQILLLIQTLLLFLAGSLRQIPSLIALLPLFLAAQCCAVFAWSALGILLGQITKRYVAMAIVYGAIVELGIGRIPTNINNLSLSRHLKTLLAHNPALLGIYDWSGQGVPFAVAALIVATGLFVGLATLLFTFLEYHPSSEMQK